MKHLSNTELLVLLCGDTGKALAGKPLAELFGFTKAYEYGSLANEDRVPYMVHPAIAAAKELYIRAIDEDMRNGISLAEGPKVVREFLCGRLAALEHEVFWCLVLDAQSRLICIEELFRGTLTQTNVYPREIVKTVLAHNASGVILVHNHPSGSSAPSSADLLLTTRIKEVLSGVDVRLLDHFVVGGNVATSFAEQGLL